MSSMVLSPTSLRLIFSACLAVLVPTQECRAQSSQQVIQKPPAQSHPTANPTDQSKSDFKCESPEVVDKIKYLSVCILTDGKNFCQDTNLNTTKASEILKFNDEDLTARCLSFKITDPRIPNICSFLPGEIKEVEMVSRQYALFATAFDPNIQKYHCLINLTVDWKNQFPTIRKMMSYMFGSMIQQIPLPSGQFMDRKKGS